MGSMNECRIEGFICRLCSQIDRNVIHIYSDEGLIKKLEQKINVYLKISLTRHDPLPKVICVPCDAKLEQHHRFIQRVIQNQKKIHGERMGERPIIPLLEQHLRVRVSPVVREDGSGSNTYNIEAISSSDSDSSTSDDPMSPLNSQPDESFNLNPAHNNDEENRIHSDIEALSDDDSSSDSSHHTSTADNFLSDHWTPSPQIVYPENSNESSRDEAEVVAEESYSDSSNEDPTDVIQLDNSDVI